MGRTNKLTDAEAKAANAIPTAAAAFAGSKIVESVKNAGEAVVPLALLGVFVWVTVQARRTLDGDEMRGGYGGVPGPFSDRVGFIVGPIVSKMLPGGLQDNGIYLGNKYGADPMRGQVYDPAIDADIRREGWWEPVWAVSNGDRRLVAYRLQWAPALILAVMVILLIHYGPEMIKAFAGLVRL